MNYQKITQKVHDDDICTKLDCDYSELLYYAWPQTFGSTTGPFGGFGGQTMSTFTIEAYSNGRDALLYCSGRFWKRIEKFDPVEGIKGRYR